MNIVYASDDNFAEMLGISMISLFENNKKSEEITVYIMDDGIRKDNKEKIYLVAEKYGRKIVFIPIPDLHELSGVEIKTNDRWHLSTFSRLFLEKILPENVDKLIYLDCDTLVLDSLEELFGIELNDYCCGGVLDCISDLHKTNAGLKAEDNYFNAGVLLISLDNWRKDSLCDKFVEFINRYDGSIPYVDQGVINGTICSRIKPIELKYDVYTAVIDFSYSDLLKYRKPSRYYSEKEVSGAVKDPVIIHFTTSFLSLRPWVEGCEHPFAKEWLKYKAMSPWENVPLRKDNRSGKEKFAVRVYNFLPRILSVSIAGALHSTIVPMINKR